MEKEDRQPNWQEGLHLHFSTGDQSIFVPLLRKCHKTGAPAGRYVANKPHSRFENLSGIR